VRDAKTQEEPIKMRFDGAARHIELTGNFFVIAALQKQFCDLPFPRSELDLGVLHVASPFSPAYFPATHRQVPSPWLNGVGQTTPQFLATASARER